VVSLVDKEKMRSDLSVISDMLKVWTKSLSATRITTAMNTIETIANDALNNSNVIIYIYIINIYNLINI
jgi:hypothetical protein